MLSHLKYAVIIMLSFTAPISHADSKKLFCYEEDASGFTVGFQRSYFNTRRYALDIDFDNPSLTGGGDDIGMFGATCQTRTWVDGSELFSCVNAFNTHTFVLDLSSLVFVRSAALIGDSPLIAHGKCESF